MRPNILLITADDLNHNSVGYMGCKTDTITPNLDKLASEGVVFRHAHVTIAVCQPSRQVLMTGRYPHRNGAPGFDPINEDCPTLQEQLTEVGYLNGIIGKTSHLKPKHKYCWDYYIDTFVTEHDFGRDPKKYYEYTKDFLTRSNEEGKPFFLMANSHDPHRPFANAAREVEKFGSHIAVRKEYGPEEVEVPAFIPDIADVRKEVAQYYTSVYRLDETVGEILRALDESGQADNTLVMFLSDNGMDFPFGKSNCYLNSTRTPWVVRWPGKIKPGVVEKEMISGIDFMPTVLEAIRLPLIEGMDGRSFMPLLRGESQDDRDSVFTVYNTTSAKRVYPMRCIRTKKYGYIFNAWSDQTTFYQSSAKSDMTYSAMVEAAKNDAEIARRVHLFDYRVPEEFFDFEKDPDALNNLIDHPDYQELISDMKKQLLAKMEATDDPLVSTFQKVV